MKSLSIFLITIFMLSAQAAKADTFEDEVRAILKASNALEGAVALIDARLSQQQPEMARQLLNAYGSRSDSITRDDVDGLLAEFRVLFLQRMVPELEKLIIEEYRAAFTLEEIQEVRTLMENPAMQKFNRRSTELLSGAQQRSAIVGSNLASEILNGLLKENPKFQP